METNNQQNLFSQKKPWNSKEDWKKEWVGMPEFHQEDLTSYRKIIVHFRNEEDIAEFAKLMKQKITPKLKSLWYPEMPIRKNVDKRYVDSES